ncbi:MAG TPA: PKD domain-containing protein [Nocardioidaceae bacterium]|nr:PKD domain-containing protein [Nocardioidaceae bacterium]
MGAHTAAARRRGSVLKLVVVAALVLAAQSLGLVAAHADTSVLSQRIDGMTYQTNAPVNAVLTVGTTTYIGGDFTSVRPAGSAAGTNEVPRSHLAAVDNVTGALLPWNPGANGSVYALAGPPDGSRVYVGGNFSVLAGVTHKRLGAVTPYVPGTASAGGSSVGAFAVSADGKVYALAATASTVYLGGTFTTVDATARSRAAAVNTDGSLVAAWAPVMNDSVRSIALSPDGSWAYVGGEFTTVNGLPSEKNLTKLSPTTAAISKLSQHPLYPLWSVVVTPDAVFVGGNGAGGHASELTTSGTQLWKFQTDGGVQAVYFLDGVLYVGGHFDNVCTGDTDGPTSGFKCPAGTVGATRHKLVAVIPDASSTLGYDVAPWNPGANSPLGVFAFDSTGSNLQVGGQFTTIGGVHQQGYAEFTANQAPVASFTSSCSVLTCSFNARASSDTGGPIASYAWDFGDGTTATGATATHTWARNGTPSVTLTVTDNEGLKTSMTQTVSVASALPTARFTVSCPDLTCSLDASGSSDPDGTISSYAWTFSDGGTGSGVTASHDFSATGAGSYDVTLTVTDNTGGTVASTQTVKVAPAEQSPISYVDGSAVAVNKTASSFSLTVPRSAVQAGDQMLLTLTDNNSATATDPVGWTKVGSRTMSSDASSGTSTVWQRIADDSDPGSTVTVQLSASSKAALTLVAYRGTSTTTPVTGASAAETVSRASHTTPAVTNIPSGAWVVSYWADRSTSTTSWTAPPGEATRLTSFGAAGSTATIDALVTDSGAQVAAGSRAGLTATADASTGKAAMWTLVLAPAS